MILWHAKFIEYCGMELLSVYVYTLPKHIQYVELDRRVTAKVCDPIVVTKSNSTKNYGHLIGLGVVAFG